MTKPKNNPKKRLPRPSDDQRRPTVAPPVRHAEPPRFATRDALATRNLTTRALAVRANSYNEADRSFEAVVATETPAQVMDWRTWDTVDEILVASGGEFPERCPLLDSHNRYQSKDVLGSARNFRRDGGDWLGRGYFADGDSDVDKIAFRVRDGHITDVSIGYEVLASVDIPARTTQEINGRPYTAGERTLRVTTRWRVRELSVTPIGADTQAKIRSQLGGGSAAAPALRSTLAMNPRLLAYIRSLSHNPHATEEECRSYMAVLRGVERTIANILDYAVDDTAARTSSDLAIRQLGFDPQSPASPLTRSRREEEEDDEEREDEDMEDEEREGDEEEERQEEEEEEETPRKKRKRKRKRSLPSHASIRAEAVRDERARVAQLREMAGSLVPEEILNRAINNNWSVERAGVAFMQAVTDSRGEPLAGGVPSASPAGHSRESATNFERDALVAALMMRGSTGSGSGNRGLDDPVKRRFVYNQRTGRMTFVDASNDAAWCRAVERGYELRGLPMVEVCRRTLEQGGIRVEPVASLVVRALLSERAMGATTQALLGIFTQTFGALMLDSFTSTPDTTEGWTIDRDNPNFLQNERHRITKGGELTRHAKGGEAEDMGLEDTTEYTRVFRYSGKTAIDEIDLINDTMFDAMRGATPQEMGESGRRLRPNLVYSLLLANPDLADGDALFNTTYGNLLYEHPLSKENLQAGTTVIRTRQENGVNIDLEARFLITPHAKWYDAKELIRSAQVVITGTTDVVRPVANALVDDGLQHISDSRLDNGVTDPATGTSYAGNTDDYYVAAPPSRHTIEVTHLRGGSRAPEIRSGMFEPGSGQWGIRFDAKRDLGAKALARAGLCKLVASAEPT
jgi:hypothetical protein